MSALMARVTERRRDLPDGRTYFVILHATHHAGLMPDLVHDQGHACDRLLGMRVVLVSDPDVPAFEPLILTDLGLVDVLKSTITALRVVG